jgi:hypothetical protein
LFRGLVKVHFPVTVATSISHLPAISALFSALLGYNPMQIILGAKGLALLPPASRAVVVGRSFFPHLIAKPFMDALATVFIFAMVMSLVAAIASLLRGPHYVYQEEGAEHPSGLDRRQIKLLALAAVWKARDGAQAGASRVERDRLVRALSLLEMLERSDERALQNGKASSH